MTFQTCSPELFTPWGWGPGLKKKNHPIVLEIDVSLPALCSEVNIYAAKEPGVHCSLASGVKNKQEKGEVEAAIPLILLLSFSRQYGACSGNSASNQRNPGTRIRPWRERHGTESRRESVGERRAVVDDGGGGHVPGALRADYGHPPRPPVLQLRRQQQVDGHARTVRRLASARHPSLPYTAPRRRGAPAGGGQDGGYLRGPRDHHRLRQPDVLVRPAVPASVHLLARGRHAARVQLHHLAPHQRAALHGAHRQLRRRAHLLRRPARRRILLRRDLQQRAARQVPARLCPHAVRLRHLRAHLVPHRGHLREGGQDEDVPVGAAGAAVHEHRGVAGVGDGAVRIGGLEDDPGGDGGVQGREGEVRGDAGGDGGVVAGDGCGDAAADHEGVVAVRQRDGHGGAAAGAGVRGRAVRGQDDGLEGRGHAHGRVGVHLVRLPALPRRPARGRGEGQSGRVLRLRGAHGKRGRFARLRLLSRASEFLAHLVSL